MAHSAFDLAAQNRLKPRPDMPDMYELPSGSSAEHISTSVILPTDRLPDMYDLPSESAQEAMPDEFHVYQPQLLNDTFVPPHHAKEAVFTATDLYLYYDEQRPLYYKRPDWFAVIDGSRLYEGRKGQDLRLSYVMWQEKIPPFVVVELLSPGTEKDDLGERLRDVEQPPSKWEVYERILQVPYYFVYSRHTDEFRAFVLRDGRYAEQAMPEQRLWLPEINLGLGVWQGDYKGFNRAWLRWYDADGHWLANEIELRQQEMERRKQETELRKQETERRQQAEQRASDAEQRAERLAAQLRALGIEPE